MNMKRIQCGCIIKHFQRQEFVATCMSDVNGSIYGLVGFGFGWVRNNEESFG
jgi:hypothetical protein